MFYPFIDDESVELIGAEAGGRGPDARASTPPASRQGRPGVLHGSFSYVLQDDDGQTDDVHSISAGLDYPGVGPEHSYWKDAGRVRYESITDAEALDAYDATRASRRGSCPPSSRATPSPRRSRRPPGSGAGKVLVVCLSGRGDKDAFEVARLRGEPM